MFYTNVYYIQLENEKISVVKSNSGNLKVGESLLRRFEEIHDYIYANEGLSSHQTLNEFVKILFVKIVDENQHHQQFYITGSELTHHAEDVFERINKLFQFAKKEYQNIFDETESLNTSSKTLSFIVSKLQHVNLVNDSNDASGLAFQKFLSHYEKDGRGQFFTPQPVIDFCVKIINPQKTETIIDPCCGSGGFLYSALKHLQAENPDFDNSSFLSGNLYGIDINKDIAKIAKMKLLLEANTPNNIVCYNSLGDIDTLQLQINTRNLSKFEGFDILLTNPPFGTSGKITDPHILHKYDMGYKWKSDGNKFIKTKTLSNGQPAEILFIERCLQLLKEGGRMGIVLPNGHFENPSLDYLRYYIKQKAKILGVINLPQETFIPYGTGVKTSLLFLEKQTSNNDSEYPLFFGKITKLGYQGNKNGTPIYKKDRFGNPVLKNGTPTLDEDFSKVLTDYKKYARNGCRTFAGLSYVINYNELNSRLDYDFYSPANHEILNKISASSVKLGEIVDIVKVKSAKLKNKELDVEYIELSDINAHSLEIINSTNYKVHELPSRASYELKESDIITAVAGNSIGTEKHASALVTSKYADCICTNGLRILRNPRIDKYYLLYYLRSELFLKQVMMYRTGAAIPSLSDKDLANIMVYIPSDDVVKQISAKVQRSLAMRIKSSQILDSISL